MVDIRIDFNDQVADVLKNAPSRVSKAIDRVVKGIAATAFVRIKLATPRDSGFAAGNWQRTDLGKLSIISNSTPYIGVLEFGGYPVVAIGAGGAGGIFGGGAGGSKLIRGKAALGGFDPGPRTQRAPGGTPKMLSNVSRQAPSGMVRKVLKDIEPEFVFDLEEALDRALSGVL